MITLPGISAVDTGGTTTFSWGDGDGSDESIQHCIILFCIGIGVSIMDIWYFDIWQLWHQEIQWIFIIISVLIT